MQSCSKLVEPRAGAALAWALALWAGGCVFDAEERCGPGQELGLYGCECAPGYVRSEGGCVPCGANEIVQGGQCVCEPGYFRPIAAAPCEPIPAALGASCEPGVVECSDPQFSYCASGGLGDFYCTNAGCQSSADCYAGYACETSNGASYCRRPPVGQGQPCSTASDCEGTEATFCLPISPKVCLVEGCSLGGDDCHEGWVCCDFSAYADLGLPPTLCVPEGDC